MRIRSSTSKIIETLKLFNIHFNYDKNKFLILAYGCRNEVAVVDKLDANGVSIFSFKKHAFVDTVFTLMLVFRKKSLEAQEFSQIMQYLLAAYSIGIIGGNFNYDLLKVTENKLSDIFGG